MMYLLRITLALLFLSLVSPVSAAAEGVSDPQFKAANIGDGISLHYVEQGSGPTVIFVHGSLSDYSYWRGQVAAFAGSYHVIAYSRRYNSPNVNPARPDYSAITDSDDLAALIKTLHLGKVFVIGHSYGALTALFLASRHPELLRAMVLAEPPAMTLLDHLEGAEAAPGRALFADVQKNMVEPMKQAFARGEREKGVAIFVDYVYRDPGKWASFSTQDKAETMKDAHEWDVMMTSGTLFPAISPDAVRAIKTPTLLMSGGKSYQFLGMTDTELALLLPNNKRIIFPDAGHQMWLQHPAEARADAENFFALHP